MGDFFKPWRRKIGVLTLVMACGFMGLWIKSSKDCYFIQLLGQRFAAGPNGISIFVTPKYHFNWVTFHSEPTDDRFPFRGFDGEWLWESQCPGFKFGKAEHVCGLPFQHATIFWVSTAPYWSIVMPTTLLAAYLLLSKMRIAKPKTIAESGIAH